MNLFSFVLIFVFIHGALCTNNLADPNRPFPRGCDQKQALQCEYDFLLCKLFNGPANDRGTLCDCAKIFYGECIRLAGCETANEVGPLTQHEQYMKTCVDFIMENDCPDPMICSINCASDTYVDTSIMKILPFNNYGQYHLRIRTCLFKVHEQRLSRYSIVDQKACKAMSDYNICTRWIPPSTFVPVALPINTTYIEIDSCEIQFNNTYVCRTTDPAPARIFGNKYLFPLSYDVAQTSTSICKSDSETMYALRRMINCCDRRLSGQLLRHPLPPCHLLAEDHHSGSI